MKICIQSLTHNQVVSNCGVKIPIDDIEYAFLSIIQDTQCNMYDAVQKVQSRYSLCFNALIRISLVKFVETHRFLFQ